MPRKCYPKFKFLHHVSRNPLQRKLSKVKCAKSDAISSKTKNKKQKKLN